MRWRRGAAAEDFTRALPRVLSLYVFSFLDPRSLSRCAQVSASLLSQQFLAFIAEMVR